MNLFLFPESPDLTGGYGIVVNSDYNKSDISDSDTVVWYTDNVESDLLEDSEHIIKRPGIISFKRLMNLMRIRFSAELTSSDIKFLKEQKFERIFCGDVSLYRAVRHLFPEDKITVRFHNCFSRIYRRKKQLGLRLNAKFEMDMRLLSRLEQEIFLDENVYKVFISDEDQDYYKSMTCADDCEVWGVEPDMSKAMVSRRNHSFDRKLIWFGGVESHKSKSIYVFINDVLPELRREFPNIEFHLWGKRTEQFNNPRLNIFGHGFYRGEGLPDRNDALYVNPDIVGGGVKIKIMTYLEEGVPFITTPFGFEGYNQDYIENHYCIVEELDQWAGVIAKLLNSKCIGE